MGGAPNLSGSSAIPSFATLRYDGKNGVAIDVSYVVTTGETGILHLPPRPANSPYSQVTFSTVTKGDVSIYAYGALIATRSNEGKTCH